LTQKCQTSERGWLGQFSLPKLAAKNHSWIHLPKPRGASHAVLDLTSLVRTMERRNLLWGGQMIDDAMMAKSATKAWIWHGWKKVNHKLFYLPYT